MLVQLRALLATGTELDAVLVSDSEGASPREALIACRAHTSAPIILFRSTNLSYEDSGFDLVVPSLTPPEVWLDDVTATIERSRAELPIRD